MTTEFTVLINELRGLILFVVHIMYIYIYMSVYMMSVLYSVQWGVWGRGSLCGQVLESDEYSNRTFSPIRI